MDEALNTFLKTLAPFDETELEKAADHFKFQLIKKDSFYLKAGHFSDRVGFLKSGLFRSYFVANNKETTTFFASPGTIIVDLHSFLQKIPSTETYQALEDSEVLYIKRDALYSLYKEDWKWQQVGRVLMETYFVASEERTTRLQNKTAQELYQNFVKQNPDVLKSASLSYIASYLGMTPETLSRVRRCK